MNNVPPDRDRPDDADELYRRASARDPSRPSDEVRRVVLAHAEQLALQHARRTVSVADGALRRWLRQAWERPAVFGTLAAAVVAGLVIVPLWSVLGSRFGPGAPAELEAVSVTAMTAPGEEVPMNEPSPAPAAPAASTDRLARQSVAARSSLRAAPASGALAKGAPASPSAPAANAAAEAERDRVALADARAALSAGAAHEERSVASPEPRVKITSVDTLSAGAPAAMKPTAPEPAVAFRDAAQAGDVAALEALLDRQRDIDSRDAEGRTALMLAITHSRANAVSALLAYGADPNAADARGKTPLQAAQAGDHPEIVAALRHYGAR